MIREVSHVCLQKTLPESNRTTYRCMDVRAYRCTYVIMYICIHDKNTICPRHLRWWGHKMLKLYVRAFFNAIIWSNNGTSFQFEVSEYTSIFSSHFTKRNSLCDLLFASLF